MQYHVKYPEHFHPILIQLAKNVKWLLEQSISVEREQIQLQYIQLFAEHNLTTIMTRNVHRVKLKKAVLNYYPPNLLKILGCDIQRSENWLLNWKTMEHPLHHLLLIQFLCENPSEILTQTQYCTNYISKGPQPCLNHMVKLQRVKSVL